MTGKLLQKVRYVAGLSQNDIAGALNISQVAVSKMEAGIMAIHPRNKEKLFKLFLDSGINESDIILLSEIVQASNLKRGKTL